MAFALLALLCFCSLRLTCAIYKFDGHVWSYQNEKGDGPGVWDILSPKCGPHDLTSPIQITGQVPRQDPVGLFMEGTRHTEVYHRNMDHTVVTTLGSRNGMGRADGNFKVKFEKPLDVGIGMNDNFCLDRMEWRWGVDNSHGSEHWIGGKPEPIELQFHLFNCTHADYTDAVRSAMNAEATDPEAGSQGHLLSMAVLYRASSGVVSPEPIRILTGKMGLIRDPKNAFQPYRIPEFKENNKFDVTDVLPLKRDFYAYMGRMTRPPCALTSWVVFREPVNIGIIQANEIRLGVFDRYMRPVRFNARPLQHFTATKSHLTLYAP